MNKMLNRGKVLISCVSVLAILAVSVLSVFSGGLFSVFAEEDTTEGEPTITYPLNGKYDADYTEVTKEGIWYEAIDFSKKTKIDKFTAYDVNFCVDPNTEGNGTANTPYIIKTANQFAAVVTGTLKDANGNWIDTEGLTFKIADDIYGFDLNNTDSTVDFSKDSLTAQEVEAALKNAKVTAGLEWKFNGGNKVFRGRFDGNGACVFGLKADGGYVGIFPKIGGNITVKNLTVKNCFFRGTNVSAFFGANTNPNAKAGTNTKHYMYNCQAYGNVLICTFNADEALQKAGIIIGQTEYPTETCMVVNDTIIYGNIAKHAENDDNISNNRNIKYGIVANLHRDKSLTLNNCIILDCPPNALYYGSNAHLTSSYHNLYTNVMTTEYENFDVRKNGGTYRYTYKYTVTGGTPTVNFDRYNENGVSDVDSGRGYHRDLTGSTVYPVKNSSEITSATSLEGIDTERWTYNKGKYPTPKVYKVREYSAGTNWTGEQAVQYSEGDGSSGAPYVISTAEELALMLTKPVMGAYYKLGADIAINDTSAENWTENAKTWFTSNDVPVFEASFNGNGHTVSGIYYDGKQVGESVGLIPVVGNTAEIRELTVADSVIKANKGGAGAIAGSIADKCGKVVKFNADTVKDTVIFEGKADFGGIIGNVGYSALQMNDCFSETHGLFNKVTGEAKVSRSISVGAYPFADVNSVIAKGVYTDTAGAEAQGIYVIANEQMMGSEASKNMPELNFPNSWATSEDSYPVATGVAASAEGEVGAVWSGSIATKYAGGSGTKDDPYLISTPEQLAKLVSSRYRPAPTAEQKESMSKEELNAWNVEQIKYYKLTDDIYLNDVNGKLWADKIGCLDWFTQWVNGIYTTNSHINLDGDGHVIYGMYFYHPYGSSPYVRVGLFPVLSEYSTIQNLGMSNVHLEGVSVPNTDPNYLSDTMGAFVGVCEDYDKDYAFDSHDAPGSREKVADGIYEDLALKFKNCFVDHNSYISSYFSGGYIGSPYASPILENCLFTGSIDGHEDQYYTGALTGCDSTYATQLRGCVVFPTTDKLPIVGGSHGASWRTNQNYWTTFAEPVYYFNLKQQFGADYKKISKPQDRFGDAARAAMPLLNWSDSGYEGWAVVEGGVPLPAIFRKHRTVEEFEALSCKKFKTPSVTVSFVSGTTEFTIPELTGEMYSKEGFKLPELERPGFEFTGWYVFPDFSIKYPNDYFPPRDIVLYAGWKQMGVTQDFEQYTDSIWDYDGDYWILNKPGVKGGYKNEYVRNGSKSMHLLGNKPEFSDCLVNYEQMLVPGTAYTLTFWVTTDKADNPPTLLSIVHNSYPDYLNTATAVENAAVITGLKVGEWTQYSYSFTARTQWVSLRATGNSSLYFDDMVLASLDGVLSDGKVVLLNSKPETEAPDTSDSLSVAVLISVIMACAAIAVVSRKNLVEVVED